MGAMRGLGMILGRFAPSFGAPSSCSALVVADSIRAEQELGAPGMEAFAKTSGNHFPTPGVISGGIRHD